MGSIQNLLNPLNSASPQRRSPSPTQQNKSREADSAILSLANDNASSSSQAPSTLDVSPAVAAKQPNSSHAANTGYVMESMQFEPMQRTSSDRGRSHGAGGTVALGEIRVLWPGRGMDEAGGSSSDAGPGNRSQGTPSSSPLADLLNPAESSSVNLNVSSSRTQGPPEKSSPPSVPPAVLSPAPSRPPAHHPPTFVLSRVPMEEIVENDEDMNVDIVGEEDEKPAAIPTGGTTTTVTLQSEPMHKSKSTDSERTIDDPVTSLPVPKPSTPTTPIPSRKRKFTPELPDETLAHELPPKLETSSSLPCEPTIPIEKPIPGTLKAAKKPKKTPVKRPPSVKKKQGVNGHKRRPSAREKSESVDDISSVRQSSVTPSEASTSSHGSTTRTSKQAYCVCRKPDQGTWMINCEICNDWFHGSCVSLEESDEPLIDNYVCPPCTAEGKGKTSWIRKCRLEDCKNPAVRAVKPTKTNKGAKGSKYCSEEHARQFFRQKLNSLDTETLTKEALKALVEGAKSVDQFKVLGAEEPLIPEALLSQFRIPEDESRLADLRLEREKISRKLEIVSLRQQFLHFVIEKTKATNADLKTSQPAAPIGKAKTKPKELCGYDDRLSLDDDEFLEWSSSEEGKRVFSERKVEDERVNCAVEKRRCRHIGWQQLRGEDILMEESLLRDQLDAIHREENLIREKQKVRARNANTGNHTHAVY